MSNANSSPPTITGDFILVLSIKVPSLNAPFAIALALFIAVVALEYALSASDAAEFAADRAELAVLAAPFALDRA